MKICVYGASSDLIAPHYLQAGEALGYAMAKRGHELVFGGGAQGMMGAAARGADKGGGQIIGIAPSFFNVDGVLYENCSEFIYTETMAQRKERMEQMSDAFIMSAGGIGTFEEFFEALTLKQLGKLNKPIAILNTGGYYDSLRRLLDTAVEQKFMQEACLSLFGIFETPEAVLDYLESCPREEVDIYAMKHIQEDKA